MLNLRLEGRELDVHRSVYTGHGAADAIRAYTPAVTLELSSCFSQDETASADSYSNTFALTARTSTEHAGHCGPAGSPKSHLGEVVITLILRLDISELYGHTSASTGGIRTSEESSYIR